LFWFLARFARQTLLFSARYPWNCCHFNLALQ
jgi:hypothetical protein